MNNSAQALLLLLMLFLPLSALLARRLAFGKVVRLLVIWAGIFAAVTGVILLLRA